MRTLIPLALFFLFAACGRASAEVVVIVRQWAEAGGNYVRICDIARVEGPREEASEIGKAVIGPTPARGQSREITRWEIEQRLSEMGIEATVMFSGNETVKVFGNGDVRAGIRAEARGFDEGMLLPMPLSGGTAERRDGTGEAPGKETIRTAAQTGHGENGTAAPPSDDGAAAIRVGQAVEHYIASLYNRRDVEVEAGRVRLSEPIPADAFEVKVAEALEGRVPGRAKLSLRILDAPDSRPRTVVAEVETEVSAMAPVAARPLAKGETLGERDVRMAKVRMKPGLVYLRPDAKALENRELSRPLRPGTPILATDTVEILPVRRGSRVTVRTRGGVWQVLGSGKALGDGDLGDIVQIEDSINKVKYPARVTGRDTVSIVPVK